MRRSRRPGSSVLGLLLGVALVFLLRGEQGPLPWVARIAAYIYAAF